MLENIPYQGTYFSNGDIPNLKEQLLAKREKDVS
jgi:hypothetical protein